MNVLGRAFWVLGITFAFSASTAQSAFVNGREGFVGTTLDTSTWEVFSPISAVSQNNALTISAFQTGWGSDYTTRNFTVRPGQIVRVPVTILQNEDTNSGMVALFLTTNSAGTTNHTWHDSAYIGIMSGFNYLSTIQGGNTHGAGYNIATQRQNLGVPYIWEINRTSSNSATFSVRDMAGNLFGSYTQNNLGLNVPGGVIPDQLHIALYSQAATARYTAVEILVPEPTLMPALCMMALIARRRREPHDFRRSVR